MMKTSVQSEINRIVALVTKNFPKMAPLPKFSFTLPSDISSLTKEQREQLWSPIQWQVESVLAKAKVYLQQIEQAKHQSFEVSEDLTQEEIAQIEKQVSEICSRFAQQMIDNSQAQVDQYRAQVKRLQKQLEI